MKALKQSFTYLAMALLAASLAPAMDASPSLQELLRPLSENPPEEPVDSTAPKPPPAPKRIALPEAELTKVLREELQAGLDLTGELRIRPVRPLPPVFVHPGEWEIEVSVPPSLPDARAHLEWTVRNRGKIISRQRHPFHIELWKEVWIARRRIQRGDGLDEPAVQAAMRDILAERNRPLDTSVDLGNLEAVSTILEGNPLTWRDVEVRPAVRRGDIVDIILEQGPLSITMPAQATTDGKTGETITFRNMQTRREIQAVIAGPGRARVQLSSASPSP